MYLLQIHTYLMTRSLVMFLNIPLSVSISLNIPLSYSSAKTDRVLNTAVITRIDPALRPTL
jgi:hypothetical protein